MLTYTDVAIVQGTVVDLEIIVGPAAVTAEDDEEFVIAVVIGTLE